MRNKVVLKVVGGWVRPTRNGIVAPNKIVLLTIPSVKGRRAVFRLLVTLKLKQSKWPFWLKSGSRAARDKPPRFSA